MSREKRERETERARERERERKKGSSTGSVAETRAAECPPRCNGARGVRGRSGTRAFACWTLDKVAKSYLRAYWKLRLAMLGELRARLLGPRVHGRRASPFPSGKSLDVFLLLRRTHSSAHTNNSAGKGVLSTWSGEAARQAYSTSGATVCGVWLILLVRGFVGMALPKRRGNVGCQTPPAGVLMTILTLFPT